ncbi:MAG TPA: bifunctional nuclease family protein [Acidimicrobiales bacterium]|nr:bifunctional nuclease family protein [Acidimicrobiales bacterium]
MSARRAGRAAAGDEAPEGAVVGERALGPEVATTDGAVGGPAVEADAAADEPSGAGDDDAGDEETNAPDEAAWDEPEAWSRSSLPGEEGADEGIDAWPDTQIQLRFAEVAMVLPSTSPVVVLEEIDAPNRQLLIPVGTPEGVAIAYAARRIPTPKPLTHELFTDVLESFSLTLEVVRITDVNGTAFSAELVLAGPSGTRVVACRPSDGIALALRQRLPAPITTAAEVLDRAGVGTAEG